MKYTNKKECPETEFRKILIDIFSEYPCSASYIEEPFDIAIFNYYFLTKEQLNTIFTLVKENGKNIITPCSSNSNNDYYEYDLADNFFQTINILCGLLRDGLDNNILSIDEAFEGTKFILDWFINIHKFVLDQNYNFKINDEKVKIDQSWKKSEIYGDSWYADRYYKGLPIWLTSFAANDFKYINEFEKIIEKNIDLFSAYDFAYENEYHSPLYILDTFQKIFPFSSEFIERNYKYFNAPALLKNIHIRNSKPHLDIIFEKVIQNNINNIVEIHSHGSNLEKIKLTKEQIDEFLLLFVTNSN